jgi:hypothetical protein
MSAPAAEMPNLFDDLEIHAALCCVYAGDSSGSIPFSLNHFILLPLPISATLTASPIADVPDLFKPEIVYFLAALHLVHQRT